MNKAPRSCPIIVSSMATAWEQNLLILMSSCTGHNIGSRKNTQLLREAQGSVRFTLWWSPLNGVGNSCGSVPCRSLLMALRSRRKGVRDPSFSGLILGKLLEVSELWGWLYRLFLKTSNTSLSSLLSLLTSLSASPMSGDRGSDLIVTVGMTPIFWLLWTIGGKSFESLLKSSDDEFYPDEINTHPTGQTNCVHKDRHDSMITTGIALVTIGCTVIEI